jgi:concentrative nucleoside transporter, CNT family
MPNDTIPVSDRTPWSFRFALWSAIVGITAFAYITRDGIGLRGQSLCGVVVFLMLAASMSYSIRRVNWHTIWMGILLQVLLAGIVSRSTWAQSAFQTVGNGFSVLMNCASEGAKFVFGEAANPQGNIGFVFAFNVLPSVIFISSFFSVLYYLGVLQWIVRLFAYVMQYVLRTSGAETLSVSANVFMGQTEAPLIVRPFVPKMTQSELLTMMASGMAHISGSIMAVYIAYGADPVAILCTCVIACPCSIYLSKLVLPETSIPETMGHQKIDIPRTHENIVDAAASGVKDGLMLALNIGAMLIGFLAFIALFDAILVGIQPGLIRLGVPQGWCPARLSELLGWIFQPIAFLMGVSIEESNAMGSLLGIKLAANEHVAYVSLTKDAAFADLSPRTKVLAVYALSGFANFASIGIQLGGIGSLAPERRADLAKLGFTALFVGFMATLLNAAVAGLLM